MSAVNFLAQGKSNINLASQTWNLSFTRPVLWPHSRTAQLKILTQLNGRPTPYVRCHLWLLETTKDWQSMVAWLKLFSFFLMDTTNLKWLQLHRNQNILVKNELGLHKYHFYRTTMHWAYMIGLVNMASLHSLIIYLFKYRPCFTNSMQWSNTIYVVIDKKHEIPNII